MSREGTWWVQVYVADGTDHGFALDEKQDVEVDSRPRKLKAEGGAI